MPSIPSTGGAIHGKSPHPFMFAALYGAFTGGSDSGLRKNVTK